MIGNPITLHLYDANNWTSWNLILIFLPKKSRVASKVLIHSGFKIGIWHWLQQWGTLEMAHAEFYVFISSLRQIASSTCLAQRWHTIPSIMAGRAGNDSWTNHWIGKCWKDSSVVTPQSKIDMPCPSLTWESMAYRSRTICSPTARDPLRTAIGRIGQMVLSPEAFDSSLQGDQDSCKMLLPQ